MPWLFKRTLVIVGVGLACLLPSAALAQARPGRLIVTVIDQTGGVLPGAPVTIVGLDDATKVKTIPPARATDKGVATFENLPLGRYSVQAEFTGFDTGLVKESRVRAGDNRLTITLAISRMSDSVTVGQDRQEAAADRAASFGTALTREQMDALSDDPVEMRNQLLGIAGPDAVIRVDSFEGQQLPPKSQIKSVRISRDQFSAENHFAGGISIEIVTQPGVGPLRGSSGMRFYNSAFDGKNPLVQQKGPGQNRSLNLGISGSLMKQKSSFSLFVNGGDSYSTPVGYYVTPSGPVFGNLNIKTPGTNASVSGTVDYAVTKDQVLRFGFNSFGSTTRNQGAGGLNQIERAFMSQNTNSSFRVQEVGPLGRRFVTNTRLSVTMSDSTTHSAIEQPTIIVNDAFTSGGAQQAGGTHSRAFSLGSDLDYVRGRNSVRAGVLVDGTNYRSDKTQNYLGTYTFESLDAFNAGTPRSYTKQIGDPVIKYWNLQGGVYILDDFHLRKNFTITPGLRYEAQTHLADKNNLAPRFGVTWAPFKSGKTTLRGSWGIFNDWLSTGTYEQTLRIDGFRQQSVNIANPSYPDPGAINASTPGDKDLLGPDLLMPRTTRLSAAVQQTVNPKLSLGATYTYARGTDVFVGQNLNAPVNGVRPNPAFANIIEVTSAGRLRSHALTSNLFLNLGTPALANDPKRIVWRRGLQVNGGYTLGSSRNDSGGAFSLPSTGNLADDWGPSNEDIRHRGNIGIGTGFLKNFNASINISGSSPRPLNITTGRDGNGDLVFNDRPAGVGRNSERTSANWSSSGYFSYSFTLGKRQVNTGGGVQITSTAGALSINTTGSQSVPRYRLNVNLSVQNLANHANLTGYSGVMTSPLFLKPTQPAGVRQVTLAMSVSF